MKSPIICLWLLLACLLACKKEKQTTTFKGCQLTSVTSAHINSYLTYNNSGLATLAINNDGNNQVYSFTYDSLNRIEKILFTENTYLKIKYTGSLISEYFLYNDGIITNNTRLQYTDGLLTKSEVYSGSGEQQGYTLFITDHKHQILQSAFYTRIGESFNFVDRQVYTYSSVRADNAANLTFNIMFNTRNSNLVEHLSNPCMPASIRLESYNPLTQQTITDSELNVTYVVDEKGNASSFEIEERINSQRTQVSVAYKCND